MSKPYRRFDRRPVGQRRERGTVLVVALIFLVIMTLLGVSAMQTSVLEERMAGNLRDDRLAFEAAEAALRDGELLLRNSATTLNFGAEQGLYHSADGNAPDELTFTAAESIKYGDRTLEATLDTPTLSALPRFFIEKLPMVYRPGDEIHAGEVVNGHELYRVVARGNGASGESESVLQSAFVR